MTPADWQAVEVGLSHAFGHATLRCDGRLVTLQVRMIAPRRYEIVPYVDGLFKGAWLTEDCEERRRFFRPRTIHAFTPTQRKLHIKAFGLRRARKLLSIDKSTTVWMFSWPSFGPLKRHLVANNQQIELVKDE